MEKAGRRDHKNSTGAALSDLPHERDPMQIAKWGFFNLGLIYASCQANFGNARADVWFRTLSIYRQRNVWNLGLKVEPQRKVGIQQKGKDIFKLSLKEWKSLQSQRYEWTTEGGRLAWATDLGLPHPFRGHSTIPHLSVWIQPKCPQRSIWFVFVSHYSCSMWCTHYFHLFRSLAQSSPEVWEYL